MKFRTLFVLVSLMTLAVFATASQPDDRRFSSTLNLSESARTGLSRLSSDQIAALDAIVRHDAIVADADPTPKIPRAALFSQRLAANERELAGLALLSDSELTQLNASVERFVHPPVLAEVDDSGGGKRYNSIMLRRDPEIHGSVTLMVAGGSDGYSAYGGEINLTYVDPARRFAIDLSYSEIHSSGGRGGFCNRLYPYSYRRPGDLFPYSY